MKTDKEFYKLFAVAPEMLFELTGIQTKVAYTMKSITLKEFELRIDGFLESNRRDEPVYFVEFQAYQDDKIYHRIIKGMSIYGERYPERRIKGILFFTKESLDPKTRPWYFLRKSEDQDFQVYYFDTLLRLLEEKEPDHPLVLIFKPYLIDERDTLREHSKDWYSKLERGKLPEELKETLCTVFIRWMTERFKELSYEEVLGMLESLTPLEETRAYKELVEKGKREGKREGKHLKELEIAQKMLLRGDSVHTIIEVTDLSIEEIEGLKEG